MDNIYEDGICTECNEGHFQYVPEGSCSCHINPPCSSCVDAPLVCDKCGYSA